MSGVAVDPCLEARRVDAIQDRADALLPPAARGRSSRRALRGWLCAPPTCVREGGGTRRYERIVRLDVRTRGGAAVTHRHGYAVAPECVNRMGLTLVRRGMVLHIFYTPEQFVCLRLDKGNVVVAMVSVISTFALL